MKSSPNYPPHPSKKAHLSLNMSANGFQKAVTGFRQHLPDLSTPRFQVAKDQDADEYAEAFQKTQVPPWLYNLTKSWEQLLKEPFVGVTSDGKVYLLNVDFIPY